MKVEYSSNNSGGSWWLKDKDWIALEASGWVVEWGGLAHCHSSYDPLTPPICKTAEECRGHRKSESANDDKRWLGALARAAHKDFPGLREAIQEFERVTGQDATDEGCNCCGAPHSFSADSNYASGEDVIPILYGPSSPKTLREAADRLAQP